MFELWKLKRKRDRRNREIARLTKEVEKISPPLEPRNIDLKIDMFLSDRVSDEARALDIELPPYPDEVNWIQMNEGPAFLSASGRTHLRKLIDEERARRFEVKTLWLTKLILPILAALVGIIGAIIGLVAVLRHTK